MKIDVYKKKEKQRKSPGLQFKSGIFNANCLLLRSRISALALVFGVCLIVAYGCKKEDDISDTQNNEKIVDSDGNIYHAVVIGSQTWLVENLRTTKYNNGDQIPTTNPIILDVSDEGEKAEFQWAYNGNEEFASTYGRLYTWHVISDSRGICPKGWHVPTLTEWNKLIEYLGGDELADEKLKDTKGFNAKLGGYRYYTDFFLGLESTTCWWTSTKEDDEYAYRVILSNEDNALDVSYLFGSYGMAIRCIKD